MAIPAKLEKFGRRARTKLRIRKRLSGSNERPRVSIFRSGRHTYAQVISDDSGKTLVAASTLDKDIKPMIDKAASGLEAKVKSLKSVAAAKAVGLLLAQRAKAKSITAVVFDRNGFNYVGRVKAIADGAREGGLEF